MTASPLTTWLLLLALFSVAGIILWRCSDDGYEEVPEVVERAERHIRIFQISPYDQDSASDQTRPANDGGS